MKGDDIMLNEDQNTENAGMSEKNAKYLEFLKDIYEVSLACGTKTYIWGGMTIDLLEGKFLREHGDLDGFTERMLENLERMKSLYEDRGYITEFSDKFHILKIRKGELHASFNRLDVSKDGEMALWRHIGDHGTVYFPFEWLDEIPRDFYGVKVYSAGMKLDYAIKSKVKLLSLQWDLRDKDKEALKYLENKLRDDGIKPTDVHSKIWSYNPYVFSK
jgi:hypothetical protein